MALSFRDAQTNRRARGLAALTGETMTQTIRVTPEERLERVLRQREEPHERKRRAVMDILDEIWNLPVLDERPAHEFLGHDEHGLPT